MARITPLNPWGRAGSTLDPQRADLWQINFDLILTDIRTWLKNIPGTSSGAQRANQILQALPKMDDTPFYARRVDFPKITIGNYPVRRDNAWFVAPSYDNQPSAVTVNFFHEVKSQSASYTGAAIWALMEAWQALARAGQQVTPASGQLSVGLIAAASPPNSLKIPYKKSFYVDFLSGSAPAFAGGNSSAGLSAGSPATNSYFGASSTAGRNSDMGLGVVAEYKILNAWPSEVSLTPVSVDPGLEEIQVVFNCDGFSAQDTVPLKTKSFYGYYAGTGNPVVGG